MSASCPPPSSAMLVVWQTALKRLASGLVSTLVDGIVVAGILLWDVGLSIYNLFTPTIAMGKLIPRGHPGFRGQWPDFMPPGEGDSRCSCPALNTMANHGIIPGDGRNIRFRDLTAAIHKTYNFAPTFCIFVPRHMAQILGRSYLSGTLDLEDVDVHNGIEHDASLTREDVYFLPSQSRPSPSRVQELLACASGPAFPPSVMPTKPSGADAKLDLNRSLTLADLARLTAKRRAESRKRNPQFSLSTFHKMFGSSNSATLVTTFGGHLPAIHAFLMEERLLPGFESFSRQPMGLTMLQFNATVLPLELSVEGEVEQGWKTLI